MKKQKNACEIDGKLYLAPKTAGDRWNISHQTVTRACNDGRIVGACKDMSGHWIIPAEALKPLENEKIRQLLISILVLKNDKKMPINDEIDTQIVLGYLFDTGYINQFNSNDLRNIVLTEKGMQMATSGSMAKVDWKNAAFTMMEITSFAMTVWGTIKQIG